MRVRDMVSEVNKLVARVRTAQAKQRDSAGAAAAGAALNELATHLITPSIRYSKPELQTHVTYLYSLTNATDQRVGQDAMDRYAELRKELDRRGREMDASLGGGEEDGAGSVPRCNTERTSMSEAAFP